MNESISRAAGTQHGQELPPHDMEALIRSIGREPMQRDTLYRPVPGDRRVVSMIAADLEPIVLTRPRRKAAVG
jgi:FO synthase